MPWERFEILKQKEAAKTAPFLQKPSDNGVRNIAGNDGAPQRDLPPCEIGSMTASNKA